MDAGPSMSLSRSPSFAATCSPYGLARPQLAAAADQLHGHAVRPLLSDHPLECQISGRSHRGRRSYEAVLRRSARLLPFIFRDTDADLCGSIRILEVHAAVVCDFRNGNKSFFLWNALNLSIVQRASAPEKHGSPTFSLPHAGARGLDRVVPVEVYYFAPRLSHFL